MTEKASRPTIDMTIVPNVYLVIAACNNYLRKLHWHIIVHMLLCVSISPRMQTAFSLTISQTHCSQRNRNSLPLRFLTLTHLCTE